MVSTTTNFVSTTINFFHNPPTGLGLFLKNLDPSLFQNITLGVLAIFIPFAIVFLTDLLNSKKDRNKSEFEKMVLSDEVLGTKKVFWLAIISIIFFSFFSGTDISIQAKFIAIFVMCVFVVLFWSPFKKILRFSEGYKPEFEIPFLKKINFSKILRYKNKTKAEKMMRAWSSFWSEKSESNEKEFTKIFIDHIDNSIKYKKIKLTIELAQAYLNNIEKRDGFSVGYEILPKVFEWNEILWNKQQIWLKKYETEEKIQNFFSQKYFPTFKKITLIIFKKLNSKKDYFWNWHYFGGDFLKTVIKLSLKNGNVSYQFFECFKKHIDECEEKLKEIEDKDIREKYFNYIKGLFASFCTTFFDEINSTVSSFDIWEHYFPQEWKITKSNSGNKNARIILNEFLKWSQNKFFTIDEKSGFDKNLSEVMNGLFPNIHATLFRAFLMLYTSSDIKTAINKESNFYLTGVSVSWMGSAEESEEERDKKINEMMKEKEISERNDTIEVIINFFTSYWNKLKITLDDNNKDEWEKANEEQREAMLKNARKEKLGEIKKQIESEEIMQICKSDMQKERQRQDFLELINLLLLEIEK